MLINYKISRHLSNDRIERIAYIGANIGFGDVKYLFPYEDRYEAVTDTGVLIILAADKATIITMFLMNTKRAQAVFSQNNYPAVPAIIWQAISKNMQKGFYKNCP